MATCESVMYLNGIGLRCLRNEVHDGVHRYTEGLAIVTWEDAARCESMIWVGRNGSLRPRACNQTGDHAEAHESEYDGLTVRWFGR